MPASQAKTVRMFKESLYLAVETLQEVKVVMSMLNAAKEGREVDSSGSAV